MDSSERLAEITESLEQIDVDTFAYRQAVRKIVAEQGVFADRRVYMLPRVAPAPDLFGEWRREEYFMTTKKLRGTENTIGANALIATHGVQVPLDASDTAVERFYTSYSPADKRYFGTYAISPHSPFSLFQKKSFEGAVEFESPGNSIAATALHRVLDYPDGVVPSQGLGEFTLLKSAANQQYRQRVDDQREAVHKALRKVFKK